MKLVIILLVISLCLLNSVVYSQKLTIVRNNATLEEILLDINRQTGYYYSANSQVLESAKCVSIDVKNAELDHVLTVCFKDQQLVYSIRGNIILVKKIDLKDRMIDVDDFSKWTTPIPIREIFITECKLV